MHRRAARCGHQPTAVSGQLRAYPPDHHALQNAIRKKAESLNYLRLASRLDAVASRLNTQVQMNQVGDVQTCQLTDDRNCLLVLPLRLVQLLRNGTSFASTGGISGCMAAYHLIGS